MGSTNRYFGKFLYTLDHDQRQDYLLKLMGPTPLYHLRNCIFRLKNNIKDEAQWIISKLRNFGAYMSLHMRSVYSTRDGVEKAMHCVNKMLKLGAIEKVFVATDYDELEALARGMIQPPDAMMTMKKELETREKARKHNKELFDSFDIRDEMLDAMEEYHVLNQAQYCGSSSMEFSTFSQTALISGSCEYVDVSLGENCFVNNTNDRYVAPDKSLFCNPPFPWIKPNLAEGTLEKYYSSMIKRKVTHHYPCITNNSPYAIRNFWHDAKNGKCYENAPRRTRKREVKHPASRTRVDGEHMVVND